MKKDKEAQEKIQKLEFNFGFLSDEEAQEILETLGKLGYRKPLDRPELREKIAMGKLCNDYGMAEDAMRLCIGQNKIHQNHIDDADNFADQILALLELPKKVYCGGRNTGCSHEDNPTVEECSDCPYMTTMKPKEKPPLIKIPFASDFVEEDASAYVEGYGTGATAQRDSDIKWYEEEKL